MQKIIRFNDITIAILSNGDSYQKTGLTDEEFNTLMKATSDEDILKVMNPDYCNIYKEVEEVSNLVSSVKESNILTKKGDSVYWEEVSPLSMPKELVEAVIDAESNNDSVRIETYKNFWTLMSLNPNEECRLNLFWFLNRNGLVISRCGFFVAYRNVHVFKHDGPEEIFTDDHTHTFRIKIGDMVTMPREQCDDNQNITCSKGLICGPVY